MSVLSRLRRARWLPALLSTSLAAGALTLLVADPAAAADPTGPDATAVEPCSAGTEILAEDFATGALPDGFVAKAGSWSVTDGRLVGTGAAYAGDPARLVLDVPHLERFCVDVTMQFDTVADAGRWAGVILDIDPAATGGPWQHGMMRQDGRVAFGTRNATNTGWGTDILGTRQDALPVGTDVHLTMVVNGAHGEIWLRGDSGAAELVDSTDSLTRTERGTIGFVLDGATVEYDDIVVTDMTAAPQPEPEPEPELPATGDTVLVSEDFEDGAVPEEWMPRAGTWTVRDGRLVGQGPAYAGDPTRITFGASVPEYRFDATVRFETVADAGRWTGLILDHSASSAAPWQHALMRSNNAPVGFGKRTAGNTGWDGSDILGVAAPAANPIAVGTDIRMTVIVRGTHGEWWYQAGTMTAPVKLAQTDALARFDGTLGLILDGATVSFDDIVVTDLNPAASLCRPYTSAIAEAAADGEVGEVVFSESFGSAENVDCWTKDAGWAVVNGELVGSSATDAATVIRFGAHLPNYRFAAAVRADTITDASVVSFGADAPVWTGTWSGGILPASAFPRGETVELRVEVQGRSVSYYADGELLRTETLAARSMNGIVGLSVAGASLAIDDIEITKLGQPPLECIAPDRVPAPGETGIVVAHRGNDGNDGIADNLIPGYARAVSKGADYWESDIWLTTDGVPVVRHDAIGSVALAQFRQQFPGLPTLEEVLQFQKDSHSRHVLEYKGYWDRSGTAIVRDLIDEFGLADEIVSQSFDINTLDNIRAVDADMPIMWLTGSLSQGGDPVVVSEQHDLLGINPSGTPTAAEVAAMHAAGKKVFVWTRGPGDFASLTALGVDGIITDDSGALVEWYAAYNAQLGLQTCRDVTIEVDGAGTGVADVERQAAGVPVTVSTSPAEGHHLEALTGRAPSTLTFDADGRFTMPSQRTVVLASFAPNTWSIAYDTNGGTGDMAATTHTFGDGSGLAANAFARDGFVFAGWATTADAERAEFDGDAAAAEVTTEDGGSATLYAVWAAEPALAADVPVIVGDVKLGRTVTVDPGTWTEGTTFAYQWMLDGEPIDGATGPSLTIAKGMNGNTSLSVTVTGSLDGYAPVSETSVARRFGSGKPVED